MCTAEEKTYREPRFRAQEFLHYQRNLLFKLLTLGVASCTSRVWETCGTIRNGFGLIPTHSEESKGFDFTENDHEMGWSQSSIVRKSLIQQ